jgi:acetyl esterase/lipase
VAVLVSAAVALAACSASPAPEADPPLVPGGDGVTPHEYRAGLAAFPHLPDGVTAAPVVVLVPGGSWQSAEPAGLEPLASALAREGVVAVPVTIRAASDGVVHPAPLEDVLCALADAAATARAAGIRPTRLVLLGHSSGAHLSAVAALHPTSVRPSCRHQVVAPDALVGLAGPFDIRRFADAASALFAPDADEATWDAVNPVLLADRRPEVPVLLLHGDEDDVVPTGFSEDFAEALRAGRHPTTLRILPGVDHAEVYAEGEVAAPITQWLDSLPPAGGEALGGG